MANRLRVSGLLFLIYSLVLGSAAVRDSSAQPSARFSGYFEHQYSVSVLDGSWTQLDYDRLRVDLSARAGRSTSASAGAIWQLYRGDTELDLRGVLPASLAALADSFDTSLENQQFLNHAYITFRPGIVEVTVGKQYLTWGAGRTFNPTELFRPKNAFEPAYDREGVAALTVKVPLGVLSDVQVGLVPDGGFTESGKLLRVRHHIVGFDVSGLVATLHESPIPTSLGSFGETARRFTIGGDVTGEVAGLGVWLEATWSELAGTQWTEFTAGGNYSLEDGTLLLLEGFYNGRGQWDSPYSIQQWLGQLAGVQRTLGKFTLVGVVSRQIGQLWTVGLAGLSNVGDGSLVIIPSVGYSFADNVDLLFNGLVFAGRDGSEYGANRLGGFIRGRVYF